MLSSSPFSLSLFLILARCLSFLSFTCRICDGSHDLFLPPNVLKMLGGNNLEVLEIKDCIETDSLSAPFFFPSVCGKEKENSKEKEKEKGNIHHFSKLHTLKLWNLNCKPRDEFNLELLDNPKEIKRSFPSLRHFAFAKNNSLSMLQFGT